jgi:hypothetical protein
MAITTKGTAGSTSASSPLTYSINISSGSNLCLVVSITGRGAFGNLSSVKHNGVDLTKIVEVYSGPGSGGTSIWVLDNPATGANDIVITGNGSVDYIYSGAVALAGVNTGDLIDAYASTIGPTPTDPSINVTTNYANSMLVDATRLDYSNAEGSGQTLIYKHNDGFGASYKLAGGAGSQNMYWTCNNNSWGQCVVAIKELIVITNNAIFFGCNC